MSDSTLPLAAPSPILRAASLAVRLVAEAQEQGIEVRSVEAFGHGVYIYAEDQAHLTPALAVALRLTTRTEYDLDNGRFEFFKGTRDGIPVQTHGPIPASERSPR